jgi:hypothetical protein
VTAGALGEGRGCGWRGEWHRVGGCSWWPVGEGRVDAVHGGRCHTVSLVLTPIDSRDTWTSRHPTHVSCEVLGLQQEASRQAPRLAAMAVWWCVPSVCVAPALLYGKMASPPRKWVGQGAWGGTPRAARTHGKCSSGCRQITRCMRRVT